jgi:hypothetical protein
VESQSQEQRQTPSTDDKYRIAIEVDAMCKDSEVTEAARTFIANMRRALGESNVKPYERLIVLDLLKVAHLVGQGVLAKREGFTLDDLAPTDEERKQFAERHGDIQDAYDKAIEDLGLEGAELPFLEALELLKEAIPDLKVNATTLRGDPRNPEDRVKWEAQLREAGYSEDEIRETIDGFAEEADKRDRGEGNPHGNVSVRAKPRRSVPDNGHADGPAS